jgi:hypothetical protein
MTDQFVATSRMGICGSKAFACVRGLFLSGQLAGLRLALTLRLPAS